MTFRKFIFWLHLIAGLAAGLVIAVMSFTGAALAFEKNLVAWSERDARLVTPPSPATARLSLDELQQRVHTAQPEARPTAIVVSADPRVAVAFAFGREGTLYVNPYTGETRTSTATGLREFMRVMLNSHRYLALSGDQRPLGKAITGACNTAFLFLTLSGLWLWWPRKWRTKGLKRSLIFIRATGRARDWNWHNVIGFWSLPILVVLTASGTVISYRWAADLVNKFSGETPPPVATTVVPPAKTPPLSAPGPLLSTNAFLAAAQKNFPTWETITLNFPSEKAAAPSRTSDPAPLTASIKLSDAWPRTTTTTLTLDAITGAPLKTISLSDLPPGRRARIWLRFLHTGEALGFWGQLIAGLASLGACGLVYTGFALAWHRFFIRPKEPKQSA